MLVAIVFIMFALNHQAKEFFLGRQYTYLVTVCCIFSCDNGALIAPKMKSEKFQFARIVDYQKEVKK